jgi:hypothetical protein
LTIIRMKAMIRMRQMGAAPSEGAAWGLLGAPKETERVWHRTHRLRARRPEAKDAVKNGRDMVGRTDQRIMLI